MPLQPDHSKLAKSKRIANAAIMGGYVVLVVGLVVAMNAARRQTLATDSTARAHSDWQTWRQEAQSQHKGRGPVMRRVPKTEEPPTLVLLRDYFFTSATVLLVLSSALYFAFALLVRGALLGPKFEINTEDGPPSHHQGSGSDLG